MINPLLPQFARPVFANLALLIARLFVGGLFSLSGYYKLFDPATQGKMREALTQGHIPFVEFNVYFVSSCELIFGTLLLIGLLTRISAGVLLVLTTVAIFTVQIFTAKGDTLLYWISSVLYLPDVHVVGTCLLLIVFGAGLISFDRIIWRNIP